MLGRHASRHQRHRIVVILIAVAITGLLCWALWPSPQTPTRGAYTPISAPQVTTTTNGATVINGTTATTTKPQVSEGNSVRSGAPSPVGNPTTTVPTLVGNPTTTTTTTVPAAPSGSKVYDGSEMNPTFVQDSKNPLRVTYTATATSSIIENGQFVPTAVLPAGQLEIFTELGQVCSLPVGGTVVSGTCSTTYSAFGSHTVVANYVTGGNTYVSVILADNVQPFGTTTVAGIGGGGSLGGLIFFAAVMDVNGNAVTTGSVSLAIADTTQGWSYMVNGTLGPDGAHLDDFGCLVIENAPRVGEYSGCGLSESFVVTPESGDTLTEVATYSGDADWAESTSTETSYAMP